AAEYATRFPEFADQIPDLFEALALMEQVGPDHDDVPAIPTRLGEYRVLREVGRGGMGVVYEAVQESLGRHVALKVLPRHGLSDPRLLGRFRLEARVAARLHHTNIVPVYGVGECPGAYYYAMQFICGQGLDAVLKEVRRLWEPAAAPADPNPLTSDIARSLV